jgi:serine/threonine-protein kinase
LASKLGTFLAELKRRKVYGIAALYAAVGVAISLAVPDLFEALLLPEWTARLVIVLVVLGFPIALVLAWAYEVKPESPRPAGAEDRPAASGRPPEPEARGTVSSPGPPSADATPDQEPPKSIAVLPFVDMSPDQDQEYFCDGMAEELINALTKVEGLRVAARTSSFYFKGKSEDVREIGGQLAVRSVLEGSVRRAEERLRVTAQLISVEDGFHLWSENYDRELKDVFAIQDEISRSIVEALRPALLGQEQQELVTAPTRSLEAYDHYLRGRHYWEGRYEKGLETALSFFEKAVEIDPAYALPHTGIADAYAVLGMYGYLRPEEASERARTTAERAVELDDGLSEAHASLGFIRLLYSWDWDRSEANFLKAIELNPDNADAHAWLSLQLAVQGRFEEACEEAASAERLDPLSNYIVTISAGVFYFKRDFEKAAELLERVVARDPSYLMAVWILGGTYSQMSRHGDAVRAGERAVTLSNDALFFKGWLGYVYGRAGRQEEARALLDELHACEDSRYVSPLSFLSIDVSLGENERALDRLAQAVAEGTPYLYSIHQDPMVDPLRSDPRFTALTSQVGTGIVASGHDPVEEGVNPS